MAGYTYSKRKKQVKTAKKQSIQARKNIETEYELPAAAHGLKHVDPVYVLTVSQSGLTPWEQNAPDKWRETANNSSVPTERIPVQAAV